MNLINLKIFYSRAMNFVLTKVAIFLLNVESTFVRVFFLTFQNYHAFNFKS